MGLIRHLFGKKGDAVVAEERQKPVARALFKEADVAGLVHYLTAMPDLDETLQAAGLTRRHLTRLETDDEIAGALETRLLAVMATPWRLEGLPDDVNFIRQQLMPWLDMLVRHSWQAVPYGYAVAEVVYQRLKGGGIGIERVLNKPFWWFMPRADGALVGAYDVDTPLDTRFKFILTRRNPSYIQPYGEALLSRLYWPWYFRQTGWEHWMRWLARYGTPPLIGTGTQLQELHDALMAAVDAPAIAVPEGTTVEAVNPASGAQHFPEFEQAVTKRVQKLILGQTLTTDVGSSGSYAAAKVHDRVRDDKRLSDCKLVAAGVQQLVDALVQLNSLQPVRFVMEDERELNSERATRDATLVQAGIVSLSRDYLLRAYDFNENDIEPATGGRKGGQQPMAMMAAEGGTTLTAAQQAVESLVDTTIMAAGSPLDPAKIRQAIETADTPDAMIEVLAKMAEAGTSASEFAELTERALFAADVFGYVQAEKGKY